jgi:hypothetical protein
MSKSIHRVATVLAMALLLVGSAVAFANQDESESMTDKVLTGRLTLEDDGSYYLIEEESGAEVRLVGPEELAEHVGGKVSVTGKWASDDAGEYFEVRSIEPAAS